ncbi:hypothetical protein HDU76_002239, partial [Blyttiomyces sp. JEL0837]
MIGPGTGNLEPTMTYHNREKGTNLRVPEELSNQSALRAALHGIYRFPHQVPPQEQSIQRIRLYVDFFRGAVEQFPVRNDAVMDVGGGGGSGGGEDEFFTRQEIDQVRNAFGSMVGALPGRNITVPVHHDADTVAGEMDVDDKVGRQWDWWVDKERFETHGDGRIRVVSFYPNYGCVLVAHRVGARMDTLKLVFPDGWILDVSSFADVKSEHLYEMSVVGAGVEHIEKFVGNGAGAGGVVCFHDAVPTCVSVLECGRVEWEEVFEVERRVEMRLEDVRGTVFGDRRSAVKGQGHQKTPSFVKCLIEEAVKNLGRSRSRRERSRLGGNSGGGDGDGDGEEGEAGEVDGKDIDDSGDVVGMNKAKGGTSDVGLHTGGRARDTCFHLVFATFEVMVPSEVLRQKVWAHLHLSMLETLGKSALRKKSTGISLMEIDEDFVILKTAVRNVIKLKGMRVSVDALEKRLVDARRRIDGLVQEVEDERTRFFWLNLAREKLAFRSRGFGILREPHRPATVKTESEIEIGKLVSTNTLAFVPVGWRKLHQFADAFGWVERSWREALEFGTLQRSRVALFIAAEIERFLVKLALEEKFPQQLVQGGTATEHHAMTERDSLWKLLVYHGHMVSVWFDDPRSGNSGGCFVTIRSMQVLLHYIGFLLVHRACLEKYPMMEEFSVTLDWKMVELLAFDTEMAQRAARRVAWLVRGITFGKRGTIFDETKPMDSVHFASRVGQADPHIQKSYMVERERERVRVENYRRIVKQQEEAAKYKQMEIENMLKQEREAGGSVKISLQTARLAAQKSLERLMVCPNPVYQALPMDAELAFAVLFFMFMPDDLASLTQFIVGAHTVLVPRLPWHRAKDVDLNDLTEPHHYDSVSWLDHCRRQDVVNLPMKPPGVFKLVPLDYRPIVNLYGITSINQISNIELQCVVYPNYGFGLHSTKAFYPRRVRREMVAEYFNEGLSEQYKPLLWVVDRPDLHRLPVGSLRGNLAFEKLDLMKLIPGCDRKSFLVLGGLRSFPLQQMRKLIVALAERTLNLAHPVVVTAVRMVLYQIGEYKVSEIENPDYHGFDDKQMSRVWMQDFAENRGAEALGDVLDELANHLKETPREYESIQLLAEIAVFLAQVNPQVGRRIRRKFAAVAKDWAEQKRSEAEVPDLLAEQRMAFRADECVMIAYSLLCYGKDTLEACDLRPLLEMLVLLHHRCVLLKTVDRESKLAGLRVA